jgi:hypothetical protein
MEERKNGTTLKGNPFTLIGSEIKVGQQAPEFTALAGDLSPVTLASSKGKTRLLISVPSLDTPVCDAETRRFNEEAAKRKVNGKLIKGQVAHKFYSGVRNRSKVLKAVDDQPFRVLVSIRKLVRQGIDLSRPTMLYNVIPISNKEMFYQLGNRVCTAREGKRQPIVRLFLDNNARCVACWKIILKQVVFPSLKKEEDDDGRYLMSEKSINEAIEIMQNKNYDDGGKIVRNQTNKKKPIGRWANGS